MVRYVRVGGYPDTDPYRNEPEEEDLDRDPGWDDEDTPEGDEETYHTSRTPSEEAARVERMRADILRAFAKGKH